LSQLTSDIVNELVNIPNTVDNHWISNALYTADPKKWTDIQVTQWLKWATSEFSLEGIDISLFAMPGAKLIQLGRTEFLTRSPPFVGDILLEHLEILQKGY
jgi:Sterile alpha motif (SAM)/Pointed domain